MRLRGQLLEDGDVQNLAADRHPLPHVVEQLAIDRRPDGAAGLLQWVVRVGEQFVVRGEILEAEVLHFDHTELLQVRVRVPPAASLIEPDAVCQHLPKRALGLLQVEAAQSGFEQPLGADLRVRPIKAKHLLLGNPQLVATEPLRACTLQRTEEARADEAHEQEVIEITRLKRGVLTVVGEAENLSRVAVQPRLGAVHPAQRASDEYGGRRATALRRERGETRAITRRTALSAPAAEAEAELPGQEPHFRPGTDLPVGCDLGALSTRVAIVRLQPRVTAGSQTRARSLGSPRRGRRT